MYKAINIAIYRYFCRTNLHYLSRIYYKSKSQSGLHFCSLMMFTTLVSLLSPFSSPQPLYKYLFCFLALFVMFVKELAAIKRDNKTKIATLLWHPSYHVTVRHLL